MKRIWSGDRLDVYGEPHASGRVHVGIYWEYEYEGDTKLWPWGGLSYSQYQRWGYPSPLSWWDRLLRRSTVLEAVVEVVEMAREAERLEAAKERRKAEAEAELEAANEIRQEIESGWLSELGSA